jgi:hypothetical protein
MDSFDSRIQLPSGCIVSGPTGSGKSTYVINLLRNRERIFTHSLDYIYYFYGEYNVTIRILEREFDGQIQPIQGLPERIDNYIHDENGKYGMHVYDDLMQSAANSKEIIELTTTKCRHRNISWVIILQNLFFNGSGRLTLQRNCHYLVLFKNPLDKSMIYHMAAKIMPKNQKVFMDIFNYATSKPNGYLFIDGAQSTPEKARFRTDIFNTYQRVFIPKEVKK